MPAMRAQASAIYIGVITIVASVGPVIVSHFCVELWIMYYVLVEFVSILNTSQ